MFALFMDNIQYVSNYDSNQAKVNKTGYISTYIGRKILLILVPESYRHGVHVYVLANSSETSASFYLLVMLYNHYYFLY